MDAWSVLKYPYITEKSITMVEKENKIAFIVDRKATKEQIKKAFERTFDVKVLNVNTQITLKGDKKALIKLRPEYKAADVAVKLGLI